MGDLEGTLGSGGPSKCGGGRANCFAFQAPTWSSIRLDAAGALHLDRSAASARLVARLSHEGFGPSAYPVRPGGTLGGGR